MAESQKLTTGLTRTTAALVAAATLAGGLTPSALAVDEPAGGNATTPAVTAQAEQTPREKLQASYDAAVKLTDKQTQFAKDHANHEYYEQNGVDKLTAQLADAKKTLDNTAATDQQLADAQTAVDELTAKLEVSPFGRLADLAEQAAPRADASKYDGDTTALQTAVDAANKLLADEKSTDEQAETAYSTLDEANRKVTAKAVTALDDAITAADQIKANGRVYTTASKALFDQKYDNATKVKADANATDSGRQQAADDLVFAIKYLRVQAVEDLNAALDEAAKIADTNLYTDETATAFNTALAEAKAITGETKEADSQRVTARIKLQDAQNNLVSKTYDELNKAITDATNALNASQHYTQESKDAVTRALDAAKNTLGDKHDTTIDNQRTSARIALEAAQAKLITEARQRLGQSLTEANQFTEAAPFTDDSWAALQKAAQAGADIYKQTGLDEDTYNTVADQLDAALGNLTTRTYAALAQAMDAAGAKLNNGREYTADTFNALQQVMSAARDSLNGSKSDTSEDEHRTQLKTDLETAAANLVSVNQQSLRDAIADAHQLDAQAGSYTGDSWTMLQTAVTDGEKLDADPNASDTDLAAAAQRITDARKALISRQWDALNTTVADAQAKISDQTNGTYTAETLQAAQAALTAAQQALAGDKADLTQDEARGKAETALTQAVSALETEGHAALAAKISEAQAKIDIQAKADGKAYTADSFTPLQQKVDLAKSANDTTVPDTVRYDYVKQIDAALAGLQVESWKAGRNGYDLTRQTDGTFTGSWDLDPGKPADVQLKGSDGSDNTLTPIADTDRVDANGTLTRQYRFTDNNVTHTVTASDNDWQWNVDLNGKKTRLAYKDGWYTLDLDKPLDGNTPVDKLTIGNGDYQGLDDARTKIDGQATDAGALGLIHVTGTADYTLTANTELQQFGVKGFRITLPVDYQYGQPIQYTVPGDDKPKDLKNTDGKYTAELSGTLDETDKPDSLQLTLTDTKKTVVDVPLGDKTQTEPDKDGNTFASRTGTLTQQYEVTDPASGLKVQQTYTVTGTVRRAWNDSFTALNLIEHDPTVKDPVTLPIADFDPAKHDYVVERPNSSVKDSYTLGWKTGADATLTNVDVRVQGLSRVLTFTVNQGRGNEATYTVTVNFADASIQPDSPAKLQGIQWNPQGDPNGAMQSVPDWDPNRLDYTLSVTENDPSPYVIPKYDAAKVTVTPGKVTQTADSVRQEWIVTDKATGATRTYSVTVVRAHAWKTAVEEFKPADPIAQKSVMEPASDSDTTLASHGYVTRDGKYVPVASDTYTIPEGATFSYEPKVGQSVGVVSQRIKGMTYQYTATVLPKDMTYPKQYTFTVTYLTAKTNLAALTGIKVNGQDVKDFHADRYEYTVPVPDPQQWMVSPVYDKLTGMSVDTDKQGDTARITVTSGDGLNTVTYTVKAVKQTTLAQTGTTLGMIAIVALCLAGIAAALTGITRRMRRKNAAAADKPGDGEKPADAGNVGGNLN